MIWPTKKLGEIFLPVINEIEPNVLNQIDKGNIKEEDHITDSIFDKIEERIDQKKFTGLSVNVRRFSGRGPGSEESANGADGALILQIPDLKIKKFFIFQAKKFKNERAKFNKDAIAQRDKMLACTPDSFFLVYTPDKFYFVSAFMVGLNDCLLNLPSKSFLEFHNDFFNCFIGDHFFGFPNLPLKSPRRLSSLSDKEDLPLAKDNLLITIEDEKETQSE